MRYLRFLSPFVALTFYVWVGPLPGAVALAGEEITLRAADGGEVFGTYVKASANNDKIVILFHQARSNRHEYDPIAPELNSMGFDTLAVDQRSGGERWGYPNKTVVRRGGSTSYDDTYPDLQGALAWAVGRQYRTIVTVGSSYSASLNIVLATETRDKLTTGASFSPGEYLRDKNRVKKAAAKISVPFYVTAGVTEKGEARVDEVLSQAVDSHIKRYKARYGVHGASTLRKDRNPKGFKENLDDFKAFLAEVSSR